MTMPAGKYYIGDLCYVLDDVWEEFCSITINDRECLDGEFVLADGRRFATYGTAFGDGVYNPNIGGGCFVDAGLIGCIRVEDIKDAKGLENIDSLGIVVKFDKSFETSERDGVIRFGHVEIDTTRCGSDDEDEWDSDSDE